MNELHDLELALGSATPLLVLETQEETRLLQQFTRIGMKRDLVLFQWTITDGLRRLEIESGQVPDTREPAKVLRHIKSTPQPGVYLLLDFHPYLSDPLHVRLLKEIAMGHDTLPRTLVLMSHALEIPPELTHLASRFELNLPNREQLHAMVKQEVRHWQSRTRRQLVIDPQALDQLSHNLAGLTLSEARRLTRYAINNDGAITRDDLPELRRNKYRLLARDNLLHLVHEADDFSQVAGLEGLKQWLAERHAVGAQGEHSLDPPKGILLLGVQGSGKSLAAKASAQAMGVPLLKLDLGQLYNKYIGETEKNLRQALASAEAMAPCVLWIDEIEKGLQPGQGDDGVSGRILATLLSWMAERKSRVFLVATANEVRHLPPELLRKGRFDEIFYIDLPSEAVRQEIFRIHLLRRQQDPQTFDLPLLAQLSEEFSGAEIEQAIVAALYRSKAQRQKLTQQTLASALTETRPLSLLMRERLSEQRAWARERARPAD